MTRPKTNAQEPDQPVVRYEAGGLQVEMERDHVVQIPLAPAAAQDKQALLRKLAERPRLVAALAEDGAGSIAKLLPAERAPWPLGTGSAAPGAANAGDAADGGAAAGAGDVAGGATGAGTRANAPARGAGTAPGPDAGQGAATPGAPGGVHCACGDPGCARLAPALAAARAAWAADAELRLRQLGWTREALLAAVWAAWAAEAPLADAEAALRRAAGPHDSARREAAGPGGPPLAERLAEAAEQGRLHEPGPEFHDVDVELGPVGPPAAGAEAPQAGPDPAPWAALLPGVRGAATGLALVAERVMQRAEALAAPLRRKPD
ncbi:hypothetical protein [Paenibacillus barengoltzii]|uniref:hypothetical protein n=1 Tax=Paenibacillus barengoltzii TaxID=343517 RepID=UPI003879BD1B